MSNFTTIGRQIIDGQEYSMVGYVNDNPIWGIPIDPAESEYLPRIVCEYCGCMTKNQSVCERCGAPLSGGEIGGDNHR